MRYGAKITKQICDILESDSYTVKEVCAAVGITETTFYEWQATKSEFSEAIEKAREARRAAFKVEAEKSLLKKIQGYEVEEVKTIYTNGKDDKPRIKERTVTKKHYAPDTTAIIFALTNTDGENWRNKHQTEVTGKNGGSIKIETESDLTKLSEDELRRIAGLGQ